MKKDRIIFKRSQFLGFLFTVLFCGSDSGLKAQLRVLFLGNSYTQVNNLPQMVQDVALSAGDNLIFDMNAPGGYTLDDHSQDLNTHAKIAIGGWDYIVMQGQSLEPILASTQFNTGAGALCQKIRQYNACSIIMPYMTWGRKNGEPQYCGNYPLVCNYLLMDTTLRDIYIDLTERINSEVSPVSVVWRYIRQNHPAIELYQLDESHPSLEGSYAAACCFYAALFKKDPSLITFNPGINAGDAALIRNAAKTQVFDSLHLWDFKRPPISDFCYQVTGNNQMYFIPLNFGTVQTYFWDFGDGSTSTSIAPTHSYTANGTYTVTLTTTNCDLQGTYTSAKDTIIQFCSHTPTVYAANPWVCNYDTLWTQPADAYQWLAGNLVLPETNQYIANYAQYNTSGLSVISTLNGCSELSKAYSESPEWSGYYFDLIGNPCIGDTVAFTVLHINSFLSGSENILWYKNGVLLTSMTNQDTLLITGSGEYTCKVINPTQNCPIDTTWYTMKYDCGEVIETGMEERNRESFWRLYPNPASETITLKFSKYRPKEPVEIYSATGNLIRSIKILEATSKIDISDLAAGLYYIQPKNNKQSALKFIKQ